MTLEELIALAESGAHLTIGSSYLPDEFVRLARACHYGGATLRIVGATALQPVELLEIVRAGRGCVHLDCS